MERLRNILRYGIVILYCIAMFAYYGYDGLEFFKNRDLFIAVTTTTFMVYSALYLIIFAKLSKRDYLWITFWGAIAVLTSAMSIFHVVMFWFGLRGSDDKKMVTTFLVVQVLLFITCVYFTKDINFKWNDVYYVFGFNNPNKTSFHVYSITVAVLYLSKDSKYLLVNFAISLIVAVILYHYTHSRAFLVTSFMLGLVCVPKIVKNITFPRLKFILTLLPWAFFIGSVYLAFYYHNTEVNDFSSTRLALWYRALNEMNNFFIGDVSLFNYKETFSAICIDSDFIGAIYGFGLVGIVACLSFIGYALLILCEKRRYTELLIFSSVLVYGLFEQVFFSCANIGLIILAIAVATHDKERQIG